MSFYGRWAAYNYINHIYFHIATVYSNSAVSDPEWLNSFDRYYIQFRTFSASALFWILMIVFSQHLTWFCLGFIKHFRSFTPIKKNKVVGYILELFWSTYALIYVLAVGFPVIVGRKFSDFDIDTIGK